MDRRRKDESGLSLVELLVVLGIIAVISSVSIPMLVRSGNSSSNKADLAARELFTILRAAKIYATTHNVETAVAYGGRIVQDSLTGLDVPIVDSVAVVRKLTRKEYLLHDANRALTNAGFTPTNPPFLPLREREGGFSFLPNRTCILPDLFEISQPQFGGAQSLKGLATLRLWDISDEFILEPRLDYDLNGDTGAVENTFPAHVFSAEGGLIAPEGRQRLTLRVGILPDADIGDRFYQDPDPEVGIVVNVFFNELVEFLVPTDPLALDTPLDIDIEVILYVATGRVKVGS